MAPDTETGLFGPFGMELWEEYAASIGLEVRQAQLDFAAHRYYQCGSNIYPQLFSDTELVQYIHDVILPRLDQI